MCLCQDRCVCIKTCETAPRQLCLCYYKCVYVNTGVCLTQVCLFEWKLCLINSRYIWKKENVSKLMQMCMCKTCFCVKTGEFVICLYQNSYVCIKQVCLYQDRWDCIKTGVFVSRSAFVSRQVSLYYEKTGESVSRQIYVCQDKCLCHNLCSKIKGRTNNNIPSETECIFQCWWN